MNSWQLASINCLERLPAEALAALRGESRVKKLKHGSLVFSPDPEPGLVYLLEDGVCRIFRTTRQGSEFTLGMVLKGEIFGELGVVCNQPRTGFAVAQCDSVIWQFPRETFARMMQSCPDFSLTITKQLTGKLVRIERRAEDLVFRSVPSRLARTLLILDAEFGAKTHDVRVIQVHFTQTAL